MSRHQKFGRTETCRYCGATHTVTVTVDTWAGIACFECPECGKQQEPIGTPEGDE